MRGLVGQNVEGVTVRGFAVSENAELRNLIAETVKGQGFRIVSNDAARKSTSVQSQSEEGDVIVWTNAIVWGD